MAGDGLAHLVDRLQCEVQYALGGRLDNGDNPRAAQMLAQQHTEHGRLLGIFAGGLSEMNPRTVGAGGHQQSPAAGKGAEMEHQRVPLRLMDFVNPRPAGALQLLCDGAEKYSVKWH